jgi:hypothetical protein
MSPASDKPFHFGCNGYMSFTLKMKRQKIHGNNVHWAVKPMKDHSFGENYFQAGFNKKI